MSSQAKQWTRAQWTAIRTDDRSLLVSAAAGSGKTAVLAERCAYLVCEHAQPCKLDELLVVTFTEAAAAQMRSRIGQAIRAKLDGPLPAERAEFVQRQLDFLEQAPIGTLHGFCARLVRQHFQLARVDPSFIVMDPDEAELLRGEVARDVFARHYELDGRGAFGALIEAHGDGADAQLRAQVIHIHELLNSLVWPEAWLERAIAQLKEAAQRPLRDSALGKAFLDRISAKLDSIQRQCRAAIEILAPQAAFAAYVKQLRDCHVVLEDWAGLFASKGLEALSAAVGRYVPQKAPPIKTGVANKATAKALLDDVKDAMKGGDFIDSLALTEAQWQATQSRILPHALILAKLVSAFGEEYSRRKALLRSLDFSDLERRTLNLLQAGGDNAAAPSALARALHRQYRHVMVDEYQDINELQDNILCLVSRECLQGCGDAPPAGEIPNLFTVGDVKQSIYRFRLADPARFLDRSQRFRQCTDNSGQVIDLRENFRSRAPLLSAINNVFTRLMSRAAAEIEYDQTHHLQPPPQSGYCDDGGRQCFTGSPIELHVLPAALTRQSRSDSAEDAEESSVDAIADERDRTDFEAILCAQRIGQIIGLNGQAPMCVSDRDARGAAISRPAHAGDIVILLRALRHKADAFADILREHGIAVQSQGGAGFFDAVEIRDMLALLSLIDNQQQDIPMAAVLRSPLARLPEVEDAFARIRLTFPTSDSQTLPFHEAVVRYSRDINDELAATLRDVFTRLARWRDAARHRPLADVIWMIYQESGYLTYCAGLDGGAQRVENLMYLHRRSRQFGAFLKVGLHRFIGFLKSLREENELARPSLATDASRAVRILSIHQSKGLEFPIVFLPDVGKEHNLIDTHGTILVDRKAGIGLMGIDIDRRIRFPSLSSIMVKESLHRQTLAEELRLLYVAMTRAKEHLILIGTIKDEAMDNVLSRWSGHADAIPADEVLRGKTYLDWLAPVYAATGGEGSSTLRLFRHTQEESQSWPNPRAPRPVFTAHQERLAELKPLPQRPPDSPAADEIIRRLTRAYAFGDYVTTAAARSATQSDARRADTLELPRFFTAGNSPTASDKGTATHRLLQHLDYRAACDPGNLDRQIESMLGRQLIAPEEAALLDRASIAWFLSSDLGKEICGATEIYREVPFALAEAVQVAVDPPEAMDCVMVRGQIDLLFARNGGWAIVDFKTDRIDLDAVPGHARQYAAGQCALYRRAIETITAKPVDSVYLVFLHARVVYDVPDGDAR